MKVEIWSDVVCPWCYIGKRRFEAALERFDGAADVEIVWRSFQLNPTHPKGLREAHDESLARKLGASVEQVHELNERVVTLAADEGLEYHFETYVTINTFDAHRVTHLAKSLGLGLPIHERLLRAQLVEGEVLDDPATLVRLAAEVGIPEADTEAVLASDAYAADVETDLRTGIALGLTGVPFFVFDRAIGVSGAQPTEVFVRALTAAFEPRDPAMPTP